MSTTNLPKKTKKIEFLEKDEEYSDEEAMTNFIKEEKKLLPLKRIRKVHINSSISLQVNERLHDEVYEVSPALKHRDSQISLSPDKQYTDENETIHERFKMSGDLKDILSDFPQENTKNELLNAGYLHILEQGKIKKKYFKLIGREIYRK